RKGERHAARTSTPARQLSALEFDGDLVSRFEVAFSVERQKTSCRDDAIVVPSHGLEGPAIAFVPDHDARCNGEEVCAVRPLLAELIERLVSSARDETDAVVKHGLQRLVQVRSDLTDESPGRVAS